MNIVRSTATKLDRGFQKILSKKQAQLWNHPAGPKTVHFWCPCVKMVLTLVGAADFFRPANKISLRQNASLGVTGCIWARYCLVINPINYFLCVVNAGLGIVGMIQVGRILHHDYEHKSGLFEDKVE